MTKEEHIKYWSDQVYDDFDCALVLYKANHYAQSLFWAHLSLEKMCKALWIYKNETNTPPLVHNLLRLITQTGEIFEDEDLMFFNEMNVFQIKGRYPHYAEKLDETISQETCLQYLTKTENILKCLQQKLP